MAYVYDHYYDFSKTPYFTEMNEVFSKIFDRSVKYYLNNPDGYEIRFALYKLVEYIRDLEKSLIGLINLGYVTTSNVEFIKDTYKNLDTIGLLNSYYEERIYGLTNYNRIEINPNLGNSRTLSSKDRTLLYICHEIGHRFHFGWTRRENIDSILADQKVQACHSKLLKPIQNLVYSGYDLLDEALTQERAEEITYYFSKRKRPELSYRQSRLFGGTPFRSNYDYYGELQEPAIKFGQTLKHISKDEKTTLHQLARAAIDPRFASKIEKEYRANDKIIDLYALLHSMGTIKEATYEIFGMSEANALPKSKNALKLINDLTGSIISEQKKYIK